MGFVKQTPMNRYQTVTVNLLGKHLAEKNCMILRFPSVNPIVLLSNRGIEGVAA